MASLRDPWVGIQQRNRLESPATLRKKREHQRKSRNPNRTENEKREILSRSIELSLFLFFFFSSERSLGACAQNRACGLSATSPPRYYDGPPRRLRLGQRQRRRRRSRSRGRRREASSDERGIAASIVLSSSSVSSLYQALRRPLLLAACSHGRGRSQGKRGSGESSERRRGSGGSFDAIDGDGDVELKLARWHQAAPTLFLLRRIREAARSCCSTPSGEENRRPGAPGPEEDGGRIIQGRGG